MKPDPNKPPASRIEKKTIGLSLLLIAALGFLAYANSIFGSFIWDDESLIERNSYIKSPSYLPKLFTEAIGAGNIKAGEEERVTYSYRPIQMCTYMLDYSVWRLNAKGYHLTNILLHILVALAVYWLVSILFKDRIAALFTSIIFVVHPIHNGAVAYISGRADMLAALFMLSSFIFYLKALRKSSISLLILIAVSYILALLSRESSLIFPFLLIIYHGSFKGKPALKEFLVIFSLAFLYIAVRLGVFQALLPHASSATTIFQRLPGFFVALTNYMRLLVFPFDLHMEYGNGPFNITDPRAIAGILLLTFLIIYALRKKELALFSISWFLITLMPSSNIYPIKAYMAEHWLYIPSIGLFFIAAKALAGLYKKKNLRTAAILSVIVIVAFYSFISIRQNNYWREPLSFYERTLHYAPDSVRVNYNLANLYRDSGKLKEAIELYNKALKVNPEFADAHINLGVAYYNLKMYDEAIRLYKKAIEINPNYQGAYYNLGNAYKAMEKYEDAIYSYKKAADIAPDYIDAYNNLGNIYLKTGKEEDAAASYKKVMEIDPGFPYAYGNMGLIYYNKGKYQEAVSFYKKAIELDPSYAYAYNNLGMAYFKMGDYEEASRYTKKAIDIDPKYSAAHLNLAIVYYNDKQYELACESYERAIELGHEANPEFSKLLEPYLKKNSK